MTTPDTPGLRRRVLLRDVAAAAKVSDSTASRALADDPRISVATRQAVKAAAAELHYVPNAAARSLRMRHTSTLGLLIPNLDDPIHGQIAAGFEEEASRNGYCVIMVAGDDVPARERLALHVFAEHGADAVAIVSSAISPREGRERVDPARLVIVQPDHRTLPRHAGPVTPGVIMTDDAAGVRSAVEHLLDCGYRRIAYVEGEAGPSNALREATVATTIRGRGTRATTRTFHAEDDAWRAPAALAMEIAADPPEALVCYDDKLALALMDALRALGIRIPGDIAMIGFDGIPFTAISNPRLTTVVTPAGDMGRLAAASLIRAIRDGAPPEGHILEPELIVRESTSARPRAVEAPAADEPSAARRSVRAGG